MDAKLERRNNFDFGKEMTHGAKKEAKKLKDRFLR